MNGTAAGRPLALGHHRRYKGAMALTATIYTLSLSLSDVDRGVYESFELRVARHPSETMRFMLTRTLAYALCFEDGIALSKGGLSKAEDAPLTIRDPTGRLLAWIDIGTPSAERMHKASKAADVLHIFTYGDPERLRNDAAQKRVHKAEDVLVTHLDPAFLDALAEQVSRRCAIEIVRTEGHLYVTVGDTSLDTPVVAMPLKASD